ncbi:unnamed protein product [Closterium sp. NIES-64]|nr:unnamed protein product [Closterium sp. NIES-64]
MRKSSTFVLTRVTAVVDTGGGLVTSFSSLPVPTTLYSLSLTSVFLLLLQAVYVLALLWNGVEEAVELQGRVKREGSVLSYFHSGWNWINMALLLLQWLALITWLVLWRAVGANNMDPQYDIYESLLEVPRYWQVAGSGEGFQAAMHEYDDLQALINWRSFYFALQGVNLFFLMVWLLKLMDFQPYLSVITRSLALAMPPLLYFSPLHAAISGLVFFSCSRIVIRALFSSHSSALVPSPYLAPGTPLACRHQETQELATSIAEDVGTIVCYLFCRLTGRYASYSSILHCLKQLGARDFTADEAQRRMQRYQSLQRRAKTTVIQGFCGRKVAEVERAKMMATSGAGAVAARQRVLQVKGQSIDDISLAMILQRCHSTQVLPYSPTGGPDQEESVTSSAPAVEELSQLLLQQLGENEALFTTPKPLSKPKPGLHQIQEELVQSRESLEELKAMVASLQASLLLAAANGPSSACPHCSHCPHCPHPDATHKPTMPTAGTTSSATTTLKSAPLRAATFQANGSSPMVFFREAVLAELRRDVPNAFRDGDAGSGLLAMSALLWAVRRMDLLTGGLRRSVTNIDKVYVSGLKKLRTDMVARIKKLVAHKRAGQVGVAADACDDDGEEVHSAFQAVGVARTVADARGTTIGKPRGGVHEDDAEAGKGVTGTEEKHQDEDCGEDRDEDCEEEGGSEEDREEGRVESASELESEGEEEEEEQKKREEVEHKEQEQEKQLEGEQEEEVELEVEEQEEEQEVESVAAGAAETGERSADVENEGLAEGKGAMSADLEKEKEEVGMEAAHEGSGNVVVGDRKEGIDVEAVGEGDNATATKQTGVEVTHRGEQSRKKKAASGHPGSTAAGRQARLDVVEQLRAENRRLRADNARLERRLCEQTGRVDSLASALAGVLDKLKALTAQVADTDRNLAKRLEDATSTMATTITDNLIGNMANAVEAGKSFAELAAKILRDLDDPNGRMAVERATEVNALAEHVTNEVGEARKFLEETVIKYIGAAQTNIAAAVAPRLVVQQPPPPIAPAQALLEELMKSFKEDVLKAVTEATQKSFLASGLKIMTKVVGTKRGGDGGGGDGEDATSVKRSKGAGGSRVAGEGSKGAGGSLVVGEGSKGAGGSRVPGEGSKGAGDTGAGDSSAKQPKTVVDILKRHWATVGSPSTGHGEGSAAGGPADQNAAVPSAPTLVAEKPRAQGSGGKGLSDKETPAAKTAPVVAAKTGNGPNAKIAEATAVPKQPPAGARHPTGASPDVSSADKDSRAGKGAAAVNALKDQLRLLAGPRAAQQPPPPVAVPSANVPRQEASSSATPTSGNVAAPTPVAVGVEKVAEKGVHAVLATGGSPVEEVAPDADIATIYAQLDAAKPRTLAISDTAHAEQPASPAGGLADRKTTVKRHMHGSEGKAKRKGTAGSQRKTQEKSEVKATGKGKEKAEEMAADVMSVEKGKAGENQEKSVGEGWVGKIKVHGINRYIGKSREKMELAYVHSIAFVVYDGFVSKVLMDELTGLDTAELERWRKVWEEVKILLAGMWTVMWARGVLLPKTRLNDILDKYYECKSSGDALHDALWPAMWFPLEGVPEEKSAAMMSAMIGRVFMCVAYGKTAASASKEGDEEEKTAMAAWALATSACAVWCFVENGDAKVADAVEEGKAAALIVGRLQRRASAAESRPAKGLSGGDAGVDAKVVARATVETMAFWGMCPVASPKLKKRSIVVPCDAQMKADLDNKGRKGQRGKQGPKGKKGKDGTGKKGRKGKDSTTV